MFKIDCYFKELKHVSQIFLTFFVMCLASLQAQVDLEHYVQDFVLETRKITIPGKPCAFNPSIIRWRGKLLMSFRDIPHPQQISSLYCAANSRLYLIELDDHFQPLGEPYELPLNLSGTHSSISRAEDGRLIKVVNEDKERLYIIYSDNQDKFVSDGGFRMFIAELNFNGESFEVIHNERLSDYEGEGSDKREKNWAPFVYQGNLCLAYGQVPHKILFPLLNGSGKCETFTTTYPSVVWEWGELRGGTPALPLDDKNYLAFFHSSMEFPTVHSDGESILHYFMGAYTFSLRPPFEITKISPEPIIGKNFYRGIVYDPYWKPVRVVFPCGFIFDNDFIWVSYGRQDHEIWIVKLDKKGLLDSLIPVSNR